MVKSTSSPLSSSASSSPAPLLAVDNVSVSYGARTVVHEACFDVPHGQIFALIGLNGAGKTTLIKTILGLRDPNSGQILLDGEPGRAQAGRAKLAYLPERFEPPWFLSGREFIRFSLKLYKKEISDEEMGRHAATLALDHGVLKNRVQTYSKGMRQKLGLLATMLTGCPLLILDEPMSGLDPLARLHVKDMLRRCRDNGQTIFLSSHILADVREICDSIAVLHGTSIIYRGTPEDLCRSSGREDMEHAFLELINSQKAA